MPWTKSQHKGAAVRCKGKATGSWSKVAKKAACKMMHEGVKRGRSQRR